MNEFFPVLARLLLLLYRRRHQVYLVDGRSSHPERASSSSIL